MKMKMKIIPYREIENPDEEFDYREIQEFLVLGTAKEPYKVWFFIDNFNQEGVLNEVRCTCPHYLYRGVYCKHIETCMKILKETLDFTGDLKELGKPGEPRLEKEMS